MQKTEKEMEQYCYQETYQIPGLELGIRAVQTMETGKQAQ